jgi:tetratricopeptide (TPR) repeat protein
MTLRISLLLGSVLLAQSLPEQAVTSARLGSRLRLRGELARAEPLLRKAAQQYADAGPEYDSSRAHVYLELGLVAVAAGRDGVAEQYVRRGLSLLQSLYGPDAAEVAVAQNDLGLVYLRRRDFARAEAQFTLALRLASPAGGPDLAIYRQNLQRVGAERAGRRGRPTRNAALPPGPAGTP